MARCNQERCRVIDQLRLDVRYGLRQLARAPLFSLVASFSKAIGIGVAVTGLSIGNAVFFKQLPIRDPGSLYWLYPKDPDRGRMYNNRPFGDYEAFASSTAFSSLAAQGYGFPSVAGAGLAVAGRPVEFVTPNYFSTLGVRIAR